MVIFYGFPVDCEQLMVMAVSVELLSFDWIFFSVFYGDWSLFTA